MKKWTLSALAYLLVVVIGYYAISTINNKAEVSSASKNMHEEHSNSTHAGKKETHNDHEAEPNTNSEVQTTLKIEQQEIMINIKDQQEKPVSDIKINHEKLMHLIVVSADLSTYQHLHPEVKEPGVFTVPHSLEEGEYKAFVDIKPKNLAYEVKPIPFQIGESHDLSSHSLQPDSNLTKEIDGHQVTLNPSSLNVNQEIQLSFDLNGETPEPYLGALGHVVILDEKAEQYVHVHPQEGEKPVFETKFTEPGIYKIWAEFKFNGNVSVFPFVVEIK
ncbi:hypothetical protein [Bacillus sp. 03113]|uniref:hypothetical protein n=1 Tax=Bacillus sp. 03113 TaxID=2578211 RepID=UPI001143ACC2|nr:hypothetical protein [Bacillus sp. 03113]